MEELMDTLNKIHEISAPMQNFLKEKLEFITLKKNDHLISRGEFIDRLYFVRLGMLRSYYIDKTEEYTTSIVTENQIIVSGSCFFLQKPATNFVQATEYSELLSISRSDVDFCLEHFSEARIIFCHAVLRFYIDNEQRIFISKIRDASGRYLVTKHCFPDLVSRAPVRYLASYLSTSFETLSRIRSRIDK